MSHDSKTICVMGLGYIGLPTAAVIARSGCRVLGVDVHQHVVDTINRGEIHIEEVDLDGLVQGVVQRKLLRASTMVEPADVFVIAVPTPFGENHAPDISYVLAAGEAVLVKVNTDEQPQIAAQFHMEGIPAFALLRHGHPVAQSSGARPAGG